MLNLIANTKSEEIIKKYLEKNANNNLVDKINNGVEIVKDGIKLINKKDLDGFMTYANNEARKTVESGKNSACIEDKVVYCWAVHYFEEDSIEGKLFNLDGSEYMPVKKEIPKPQIKVEKPVTKPKVQFSMFDMINEESKVEQSEMPLKQEEIIEDSPSEDDYEDAFNQMEKDDEKEETTCTPSPMYLRYVNAQKQYPDYIICIRLGDFYEILGENAKKATETLDLILSFRDCGKNNRVPLAGFPYHIAEKYFNKLSEKYNVAILEDEKISIWKPQNIDYETGEILENIKTNNDLTQKLKTLFGNDIEVRL